MLPIDKNPRVIAGNRRLSSASFKFDINIRELLSSMIRDIGIAIVSFFLFFFSFSFFSSTGTDRLFITITSGLIIRTCRWRAFSLKQIYERLITNDNVIALPRTDETGSTSKPDITYALDRRQSDESNFQIA